MTRVAVAVLLLAMLPVAAAAQGTPCDGDFHVVHDVSDGALNAVDFAPDDTGWAVGFDYEFDEDNVSALGHGPQERPWVVRFDDDSFEEIHPPHEVGTDLTGVDALASDNVWAVGEFIPTYKRSKAIAYHWDGVSWKQMTVSKRGQFAQLNDVVAISPTDVWAVGFYSRFDERGVETLVAHYDGVEWSHVPAPSPSDAAVLNAVDSAAGKVWAVGEFRWSRPLVLRYGGGKWHHKKIGWRFRGEGQEFEALDVVGPREFWATGDKSLVVHFRAGGVHREETPNVRGNESLTGIAVAGDDVWSVGMRFVPDTPYTWAMHKDDGVWSRSSFEGPETGAIADVAVDSAGTAWAVGETFDMGGNNDNGEVIQRACL